MINFIEHTKIGYAARTEQNIKNSDITLAFAIDFISAGEQLTKRLCLENNKYYSPIFIPNDLTINLSLLRFVTGKVKQAGQLFDPIVNIAGNGIYTLKSMNFTQGDIDIYIYKYLSKIHEIVPISKIVSGGQTGVDEAGLKAGLKLGIETECLAPKGWLYRDINHKDISNEFKFKARFELTNFKIKF